MGKFMLDNFSQYPLGATARGVNEYEFVQDSQSPSQLSWAHPDNTSLFQDAFFSYDDGFKIVNTPVRVGTQSGRFFILEKDPNTYRAHRPRAHMNRNSNAGLYPEQVWFSRRWYAWSYWFPADWSSKYQHMGGDSVHLCSLHAVKGEPFSGVLPFSLRPRSDGTYEIVNDNGYSAPGHDKGPINPTQLREQWEDFVLEVVWDPYKAGDGPGGSGGTGYLKLWKNNTLIYDSGPHPQGTFQDYEAGFRTPAFNPGFGILPLVSPAVYPATIFFGYSAIGDENETLQSMSPDAGAPNSKLAPIGFSPVSGGTHTSPLSVTLTGINDVIDESPTTGATAFYSIDGAPYQTYGSISLTTPGSHTINAYQSKSGFDDSDVTLASYNINSEQLSIPIRLDTGVTSGTLPIGYSYDQGYSGTGVSKYTNTGQAIGSVPSGYTELEFRSTRFAAGPAGTLRYDLNVPNGNLEVRLLLCELSTSLSRRYKVKLQGEGTAGAWKKLDTEDEYTTLNPEQIVGRYNALVVSRIATVTNGTLSLEWEYDDDTGSKAVVGIEILNLPPPDTPPATNVLIGTV